MKKLSLLLLPYFISVSMVVSADNSAADLEKGFELRPFLQAKNLSAFTWDVQGNVWTLREVDDHLIVQWSGASAGTHSFRRNGDHSSGILVNHDRFFVSDAGTIRRFKIKAGRVEEESALVPAPALFSEHPPRLSSLRWSPLGHIHFAFHNENGIGRFDPRANQWDILTSGIDAAEFAFDENGSMIASDGMSGHLFRVALGIDYIRGLENYTKADVSLQVDRPGLKPGAVTTYTGNQWPEENKSTWLVHDHQTSSLQQYREGTNSLAYWRTLIRWKSPIRVTQLQVGPDGALWFIAADSLLRLRNQSTEEPSSTPDLTALPTPEVATYLAHSNFWHRDTALRILDVREDLLNVRGLHPSTPLSKIYQERTNSPLARVHAIWAMHRLGLLDEGPLEESADDPSPLLRAWAALLFGERKYPTGVAFEKLHKMGRDTNATVRTAVAVAARQFISSSLVLDTPPPTMPIREVFTGGILSALWFSTESGSSPEFDLLFWNAVRPICAFDAAHPLGFFQGDREEGMAISYWIIARITRLVAETDNPLKQEDGILMLKELKPANHRMLARALEGLKAASPNRKVIPTDKSLETLQHFAESKHPNVGQLAKELLDSWSKPPPKAACPVSFR